MPAVQAASILTGQSGTGPAPLIDGLSIAFDVSDAQPVDDALVTAVRRSGLAAINMTTPWPGDDFRAAVGRISGLQRIVSAHRDLFMIVREAGDIVRSVDSGRLGIIIGFQSTEMFSESLDEIAVFHGLGTRIAQVTYNGPGLLGNGCLSPDSSGVSATGHRAISIFNSLGMLIDASHANKATTAETIESSTAPVLISHTGCNAVYEHPRNNDDEELRALAEKGGVAGIYLMPFLDGGMGELTADMFIAHLEHALDVCGVDHVGIGSDQGVKPVDDGPEYRQRLRAEVEERRAAGISAPGESASRPPFIPELNRADRVPAIARMMRDRGYPGTVIDKVAGGNFYRVMKEVW